MTLACTVASDKKRGRRELPKLVDMAASDGFATGKAIADSACDEHDLRDGMDERRIPFYAKLMGAPRRTPTPPRTRKRQDHAWHSIRWRAETGFSSFRKPFGEAPRASAGDALENELDAREERCNACKVLCLL
ncbi:MAG: hypothetical protein LBS92_06050 [Candidatus Methanoplasma sp.]|jgi:hypothetical protein|nr:hypothetical protein [Candidatus Methanoplasma sp.]